MAANRTNTRAGKKASAEFRARCEAENLPCWMDGMPIDYTAAWDDFTNDDRFQKDHLYPVATHPDLQDIVEYWRPSHAGCNLARSNGDPAAPLGIPSRQWA